MIMKRAVLAYAWNFPDGLSGLVLGGNQDNRVNDAAAREIFRLTEEDVIAEY